MTFGASLALIRSVTIVRRNLGIPLELYALGNDCVIVTRCGYRKIKCHINTAGCGVGFRMTPELLEKLLRPMLG